MASSIQATRIRKGMLIKVGNDLFRILELHHLTPGNKRAHIQVRMRNIRSMALADEKPALFTDKTLDEWFNQSQGESSESAAEGPRDDFLGDDYLNGLFVHGGTPKGLPND